MGRQSRIPIPPEPYLAHKYPLKNTFSGRYDQRSTLTDWLEKGAESVFSLVAIGGMGKSALSWFWLLHDVMGISLPSIDDTTSGNKSSIVSKSSRPEGVLWWSFYEKNSHFSVFLDNALVYAGKGKRHPNQFRSPYDKVTYIVEQLEKHNLLIVLDGFEFELRLYASLNSAYAGDEVNKSETKDQLSCISPYASEFLDLIAEMPLRSRILITTRNLPITLNHKPFCRFYKLEGLEPDEAVTFFRVCGVTGSAYQIKRHCKRYGFHPLILGLLVGLINKNKRNPGDVEVLNQHPELSKVPVLTNEVRRRRHHVVQVAYDDLTKQEQDLLSRVAAFRSSAGYEELTIFNRFQGHTPFDIALDNLVERGLLFYDPQERRYDMHPIVRQYAYERLLNKKDVHKRLKGYLQTAINVLPEELQTLPEELKYLSGLLSPEVSIKTGEDKVETLKELLPVIDLYGHVINAGQYNEALILYRTRLSYPLYSQFAAYEQIIELLLPLFAKGKEKPPQVKSTEAQAWVLNELANAYSRSGRSSQAVPLRIRSNILLEKSADLKNLAIGLRNLGHMDQVMLGEFKEAEKNIRRGLGICEENGWRFHEAVGHEELAHLLIFQGDYEQAKVELDKALSMFEEEGFPKSAIITYPYQAWRYFLMKDFNNAIRVARLALAKAEEYHDERNILRAKWVLGAALISLSSELNVKRGEHLKEAIKLLREAYAQCNTTQTDMEADVVLHIARWHHKQNNNGLALQKAKDALSIAERWDARLKEAEANNFLAFILAEVGERDAARRHVKRALKIAKCDGPEHCYLAEVIKAQELLLRLA